MMFRRIRASALVSFAIATLAVAAGGCGSNGPTGSRSPSVPVGSGSSSPSSPSPASASGPAAAGCDASPWQTVPLSVTHQVAVPPVPVITAVRAAQHPECGYDRIVLDITGPIPSYSVRYVSQVIADPSGMAMTMPGRRYLLITLHSAQAHTNNGVSTVTPGVHQPGYPALTSWALAGDFEGVVRIALGLSGQDSIRVGELAGHLYVDVKE